MKYIQKKNRTEIKGSEIYDLIDILDLMKKFDTIMAGAEDYGGIL